jgi:hypothetical protein
MGSVTALPRLVDHGTLNFIQRPFREAPGSRRVVFVSDMREPPAKNGANSSEVEVFELQVELKLGVELELQLQSIS